MVEPGATELPCPRDRSTRERSRFDGADVADGPTVSIAVGSPAAELIRRVGAGLNQDIRSSRRLLLKPRSVDRWAACQWRKVRMARLPIIDQGSKQRRDTHQILGEFAESAREATGPVTEDVVPLRLQRDDGVAVRTEECVKRRWDAVSARMVFLIRMAGDTKSACEIPPPPVHGVKGHTDTDTLPSTLFCTRVTFSSIAVTLGITSGNDGLEL